MPIVRKRAAGTTPWTVDPPANALPMRQQILLIAEDFYVLQTGDPEGPAEGFIDPKTNEYRAVPLEILVKGDKVPTYGITLEDAGRYLDQPVLPFNAYGALGMARPNDEANGGSSQFFFFLFELVFEQNNFKI